MRRIGEETSLSSANDSLRPKKEQFDKRWMDEIEEDVWETIPYLTRFCTGLLLYFVVAASLAITAL